MLIGQLFLGGGEPRQFTFVFFKNTVKQPSPDSLLVTLNYKLVRARQQRNRFYPPMLAKVGPKFPFVPAELRRANAKLGGRETEAKRRML